MRARQGLNKQWTGTQRGNYDKGIGNYEWEREGDWFGYREETGRGGGNTDRSGGGGERMDRAGRAGAFAMCGKRLEGFKV